MTGRGQRGDSQRMVGSPGSVQVMGTGNVVLALTTPPTPPTPHEVARTAPRLVDRHAERDAITRRAGRKAARKVINMYGDDGLGKRAVVHEWACEHASEFPGGQVLVDVSGTSATARVPVYDALRSVLYRLASPHLVREMPAEALSGLYSSVTAESRMLVVVEGATSYEQVGPFVPHHDDSLVIVTSRLPLGDGFSLRPVSTVEVGKLDDAAARDLVRETLEEYGASALATEANVGYIVRISSGVPQRLVTNARLLGSGRCRDARHLVYEPRPGKRGQRRDALVPQPDLTDAESRRMALLEAVGGTRLTVALVASVWGMSLDTARDVLRAMEGLGLVRADEESACCARYTVDAAMRRMMRPRLVSCEEMEAGVRRALAYYRELMQEVNAALSRKRLRTYTRVGVGAVVDALVAEYAPLDLFEAERDTMLATIEIAARGGFACPWWEVGEAAWPAFRAAGYSQAGARMLSLCADACPDVTERDRLTKARLLAQAAHCFCDMGDLAAARGRIDEAVTIADGLPCDGLAGRVHASVHEFNGTILREEGSCDKAESEYQLALDYARRIGRARSESILLYLIGRVRLVRGNHASAITYFNGALALASEDDAPMRANILAHRARARLELGDYGPCTADALSAAELYNALPAPWRLAGALETLAEAHERSGRTREASEARDAARLMTRGA